jgi:epoxyqueuosine reductase
MNLLLHVCCAPCAVPAIEQLGESCSITAFFFNPNIHPEDEYKIRFEEFKKYMLRKKMPFIVHGPKPEDWFKAVEGLEKEKEGGARCVECFRFRLDETARQAAESGIPVIASTLSTGTQKDAVVINKIGAESAGKYGISFLCRDFKKKDGAKLSAAVCRKLDIYRQKYCGCVFSLKGEL